jgi:hypothetical protein
MRQTNKVGGFGKDTRPVNCVGSYLAPSLRQFNLAELDT